MQNREQRVIDSYKNGMAHLLTDSIPQWTVIMGLLETGMYMDKVVSVGELLPLVCAMGCVTLQTINMHKKLFDTLKERGKPEKHNRSALNDLFLIKYIGLSID